jgi:hypothetical protein
VSLSQLKHEFGSGRIASKAADEGAAGATKPIASIITNEKCCRKLKWAASQEAVTFPWLSAHSILKRIGGDTTIVNPQSRLSRTNFRYLKLAPELTSRY